MTSWCYELNGGFSVYWAVILDILISGLYRQILYLSFCIIYSDFAVCLNGEQSFGMCLSCKVIYSTVIRNISPGATWLECFAWCEHKEPYNTPTWIKATQTHNLRAFMSRCSAIMFAQLFASLLWQFKVLFGCWNVFSNMHWLSNLRGSARAFLIVYVNWFVTVLKCNK